VPGTTSARRLPLASSLLLVLAFGLGCRQLVVFDGFPDSGLPSDGPITDGPITDGSLPGDAHDDGGPFCPSGDSKTIIPYSTPVDVVVLLDRSTGMNAKFNDGSTLASASSEALRTIVGRYDEAVNFALVLFPGAASCPSDPSCCVAQVSPPTAFGFSSTLDSCNTPGTCAITSQRPIAQALDSSYYFYTQSFDPARYVLLLTSGDPGCSSGPGDNCDDEVSKTNNLWTNIKVHTEVIAVGLSDGSGCLNRLAQAGGLAGTASTSTSSSDLLVKIEDFVRWIARDACRLDLHPSPGNGDDVAIFQNGMPVPSGGPNGWEFDGFNRSSIRLHGTSCDRLLTNGVDELSIKACPDHH
jgi:hypothetical protein